MLNPALNHSVNSVLVVSVDEFEVFLAVLLAEDLLH